MTVYAKYGILYIIFVYYSTTYIYIYYNMYIIYFIVAVATRCPLLFPVYAVGTRRFGVGNKVNCFNIIFDTKSESSE